MPSVLAVITARGGSKGLPGKNIRPLAGKPLIAWTIEAALGSTCIDRVIVSTDSLEIADAARTAGADVPFLRPASLATDTASSVDVLLHATEQCPNYDICVLIQPTSPLLTSADLNMAFALMEKSNAEGCLSICETTDSPWLMYRIPDSGWMKPLLPAWPGGMRRQDLPPVYHLNGAFYFIRRDILLRERKLLTQRCVSHIMPKAQSIDIDTLADFAEAEAYLSCKTA